MKTIIANFKSNKNRQEIQEWISQFSGLRTQDSNSSTVVLCPPVPYLASFAETKNVELGVQDLSPFPAGAYTGAIGTHNLEGLDVRYAIIGHSERRRYFHESPQDVANKVREAVSSGITPIVCVTKEQLNETANAIEREHRAKIMVAFEPIEHIGTGESDTLEDILKTKEWVRAAFGSVPYIYGGSVNPNTDPAILHSDEIDGFLVGTACLDPKTFIELIQKVDH